MLVPLSCFRRRRRKNTERLARPFHPKVHLLRHHDLFSPPLSLREPSLFDPSFRSYPSCDLDCRKYPLSSLIESKSLESNELNTLSSSLPPLFFPSFSENYLRSSNRLQLPRWTWKLPLVLGKHGSDLRVSFTFSLPSRSLSTIFESSSSAFLPSFPLPF